MPRSRQVIATLFALAVIATAGSATALAEEFEASELPAAITGVGEGTAFKVGGGEIKCASVSYTGGFAEVSKTVSLNPVFTECKTFGGVNATATTTGCEIVASVEGTLEIACEPGSSIAFKDAFNVCQITVPAQSGLASVSLQNSEAKTEPTVTYAANVTGLTATVGGSLICPVAHGTYNNATMTGTGRLEAESEEGGAVALWLKKPRILCKQKPAGNPLTCPQGYAGEVAGTLKQDAVFQSKGGAAGSVTCKAATFTGENFTTEGKGSVKIVYNKGAACESTIAGLDEPKVVLEEGKAFGDSEFIYIRPTPFQGRMWLKTAPIAVAKLDLEGKELHCSYELKRSSANVFNPVEVGEEVKPMEVKLVGSSWARSAGGAQCPTKLRSETIFTLKQGGGGDLWVSGQ